MSSNLIPQKRMDKTGKLVTRHIRAGGPAAHSTKLPVPVITAAKTTKRKAGLKKPLAKQLEVQYRMTDSKYYSAAPEIYEALGFEKENSFPLMSIVASDVQMYEMFAILGTDNAAVLMASHHGTPEKALDLLKKNNLEHLLIDRKDTTDEAISRRISAWEFMEAQHKFGVNEADLDPEVYLGAIRLECSVNMPRWKTNGEDDSYAHQVMRGEIDYDDVMTLGIGLLAEKNTMGPHICGYLKDIYSGAANYDAEVLRHVLEKSRHMPAMLEEGMHLVSDYGSDFVMDIKYLDGALSLDRKLKNRPVSHRAEIIKYAQAGIPQFHNIGAESEIRLFDAGVPVDDAVAMLTENMDVDKIIVVHKEGIQKSMATGWL